MLYIPPNKWSSFWLSALKAWMRLITQKWLKFWTYYRLLYISTSVWPKVIMFYNFSWAKRSFLRKSWLFGGIKHWTSVWVLTQKNVFLLNFTTNLLLFLRFSAFLHKKHWKWLFWLGFGMRSTQTLVKIYNKCPAGLPAKRLGSLYTKRWQFSPGLILFIEKY